MFDAPAPAAKASQEDTDSETQMRVASYSEEGHLCLFDFSKYIGIRKFWMTAQRLRVGE